MNAAPKVKKKPAEKSGKEDPYKEAFEELLGYEEGYVPRQDQIYED